MEDYIINLGSRLIIDIPAAIISATVFWLVFNFWLKRTIKKERRKDE
jgi:hypothetical protein